MSPVAKKAGNSNYECHEKERMKDLRKRLMKEYDPEGLLSNIKADLRAEHPDESLSSASEEEDSEDDDSSSSSKNAATLHICKRSSPTSQPQQEVIVISSDEENEEK